MEIKKDDLEKMVGQYKSMEYDRDAFDEAGMITGTFQGLDYEIIFDRSTDKDTESVRTDEKGISRIYFRMAKFTQDQELDEISKTAQGYMAARDDLLHVGYGQESDFRSGDIIPIKEDDQMYGFELDLTFDKLRKFDGILSYLDACAQPLQLGPYHRGAELTFKPAYDREGIAKQWTLDLPQTGD